MLVQVSRQQPRDDIEIFVVVRREPTRVAARFFGRAARARKVARNFQNRILLHGGPLVGMPTELRRSSTRHYDSSFARKRAASRQARLHRLRNRWRPLRSARWYPGLRE